MNEVLISEFARSKQRGEAAEGSPLRPVLWSELTARLAAMRDLRDNLSGTSRFVGANFSSLAAAGSHSPSAFTDLAEPSFAEPSFAEPGEEPPHPGSQVNAMALDINPKALADRKGPALNSSLVPNCVNPGDRELK